MCSFTSSFPIEVFEALRDREQLMALAHMFMPDLATELSFVSHRMCGPSDLPTLLRTGHQMSAVLEDHSNDVERLCTRLAGSFALAIPYVRLLNPLVYKATSTFIVDCWRITIHVVSEQVEDEDCHDWPADLVRPSQFGRRQIALDRMISLFAEVSPTDSAKYASQLPPVGICVEAIYDDDDVDAPFHAQWLHTTFLEGSMPPSIVSLDTFNCYSVARSRVLPRDEYLERLGLKSTVEGYAPRTTLKKHQDVVAVACCAEGMRAPSKLVDHFDVSVPMHQLRPIVEAHPNAPAGPVLDSYCTIQIEAYHLSPQTYPRLERSAPKPTSENVCKFGVLDITG